MKAVEASRKLIERIGLDKGLSQLGVKESSIAAMTEDTFAYMGGDIDYNPVHPSRGDVKDLFKQVMTF